MRGDLRAQLRRIERLLERRRPPRSTLVRIVLPGVPESRRMTAEYAKTYHRLYIPDGDARWEQQQ